MNQNSNFQRDGRGVQTKAPPPPPPPRGGFGSFFEQHLVVKISVRI